MVSTAPRAVGQAGDRGVERRRRSRRSARRRCRARPRTGSTSAAPSVPPAPVITTTARGRSYEQVPAVDVEDGAGDERRTRRTRGTGTRRPGRWPRPSAAARCARAPRPRARGCSSTARPTASRTSPGATTFTVMPAGARSSASPLARPTRPAFDALYAASPARGRSPSTEPVKISRPPALHHAGRGAGAEERAGEVHVDDLAPHRRVGLARAGEDGRDPGVADPHVDAAPLGDGRVGDRLVERRRRSRRRCTRATGPGSSAATALRSVSVRATSATLRAALRERVGEQPAEAAAGAGDHHALAGHVGDRGRRTRGCRSAPASPSSLRAFVPTVQYTLHVQPDADLVEMHRRMLVIRGFEERVSALYRDGEVPGLRAPVDRAGGVGRRRVLAARADRRDHVDPPRPRPLPREGSRPARDVRRADGQGRGHQPRPRRLDAHRRSRRSASSAPTGSSAPACRSRPARPPRRSCATTATSRSRSSATARSRTARSTKRSTSPRCGGCR